MEQLESHDSGKKCICAADHHPDPLELERHHIWPLGMGGSDAEENVVWVCPTTHTNIHEILREMVRVITPLPFRWFTDRYEQPVSRYAYEIALKGYDLWIVM